jgi:hypothetical protein
MLREELSPSVKANARLTGVAGITLLFLLVAEVVTVVLGAARVLSVHVTIGLVLGPALVLKLGSTTWRMVNYYRGRKDYVRAGRPARLLRVLSPVLGVTMVLLVTSGTVLLVGPRSAHGGALVIHKATFYLTLLAIAPHLVRHLVAAARLTADGVARDRARPVSTLRRPWIAVLATLLLGAAFAAALSGQVDPYLHHYYAQHPHR